MIKRYLIVPFDEFNEKMLDFTVEKSAKTLRHSVLKPDRVVLEIAGEKVPECFAKYKLYSVEEILIVMRTVAWQEDDE